MHRERRYEKRSVMGAKKQTGRQTDKKRKRESEKIQVKCQSTCDYKKEVYGVKCIVRSSFKVIVFLGCYAKPNYAKMC